MRSLFVAFLLAIGTGTVTACGDPPAAVEVRDQELTVACGSCVFRIEGGQGCFWAAEVDGVFYPVTGPLPEDHEAHAADGMCRMKRTARVDGRVEFGQLVATRFELLPPADVPVGEAPPEHDHAH